MPPAEELGEESSLLGGAPLPAVPGWRGRLLDSLEARGSYPTFVLLAALAGMFATTFPITILTLSLGSIAHEFGARETTMAWVISGPMLLSAVALPLLGKLGDLHGHRRVFLAGFSASTVTAALTAFAWDPGSLIGLRTLSAVVGGATGPTSMALIFSVYPPGRRVRAMGWWSMTGAAAPALGLIAGGPLVDLLGWRVVFLLQASLSCLALILASVVLRETRRQRVRFDVAGALALAAGIAGAMVALAQAREAGITSPLVSGGLLAGVAGILVFLRVERRTRSPLLPLEFFGRRNFSASIVANAFMGSAYMGGFVIAPFVLLRLFEFSISVAAGIMLLRTLSLTIFSPVGGWLGGRIGERGAALTGTGVMTVSLALIAQAVSTRSLPAFGVGLVLQGMGHGLALPSLTSAVAGSVPETDLGIASAANRLTAQIGAAFGITLLTMVYGGQDTSEALSRAFLVGTLLSALSVGAALGMGRHRTPG